MWARIPGRGLVHSVVVTDAAVHDSQVMDELLHGEEQAVYGDKAYTSEEKKNRSMKPGELSGVSTGKPADIINSLRKTWNTITSRVRYEPKGSMLFW